MRISSRVRRVSIITALAALLILGTLSVVTSGAAVLNLALPGGSSSHVTCAGNLTLANQRTSSLDLQCAATTTTITTLGGPTGDPAPPFVACGAKRNPVMNSPYTTFAAAKAAFPNTAYVSLPAGDNSGVIGQNWKITPNTTYYFQPGVHTVGSDEFAQIAPANNDKFVGAPGAILDGRSLNAYAFAQKATGVTIEYLEIRHFVSPLDQGVVNHDAGTGWHMGHNYMHDNGGAAMMLGDKNTAVFNCLNHNAQYGFQIFGNTVRVGYNEISNNNSANVESSNPGCGCSGGMKAWGARNVVLYKNWVHNNLNVGLWVDTNNVGFDISNNVITDNTSSAIIYETSYNFHITNNYIARNDWVQGMANKGFPNPAIYISESGGEARLGSSYAISEVANNTLVDNWGGVTLWENANRYCAGAGGDHVCTLVNPRVATLTTCGTTKIATAPYIDDCRWKTKNVSVHDNSFSLTRAKVPNCTAANGCGNNALISQYGTCGGPCSPGDPYMGRFVEDNITFHQNNHFTNNSYKGPWLFEIHEQNHHVSFSAWKAAPYSQDAGSTLTP